jgi:hypothetical protein
MALSKVNPNFVEQTPYGRRNLIINGAMQVAQRGTSSTGISDAGYYTVDRYRLTYNGTPDELRFTQEQSTDAPAGFSNSLKLTVTTAETTLAADERIRLQQRIEGQNVQHLKYGTSDAEYLTLSFYVKSNVTGTYGIHFDNRDSTRSVCASYTINAANTWEKKTVSIAGDTTGSFTNDNGQSLNPSWVLAAGTDYTSGTFATSWEASTNANEAPSGQADITDTISNSWQITGIQLEVGDIATPFEHKSFNEEWEACQRYCTVYNVGGGNVHSNNIIGNDAPVPGSGGHIDVGNRCEWFLSYPVKRTQPTITVTNPTHMRWLGPSNAVRDGNGAVTYPVGTSIQRANIFQGVNGDFPTSVSPSYWGHAGGGTYPKITIDAEL